MSTQAYKRPEWFLYREECLKLAEYKCNRCERHQEDAPLQVHHPYYKKGLLPWEYEKEFCVVLCRGCHAREHGKIKPIDGWTLVHSDWDTGSPSGDTVCEHCDADMKWHNDLWHPDWGVITVGYGCADKLGVPEIHEIKLKAERLKSFLHSPRWKKTPKGFRYKYGAKKVFVWLKQYGWQLVIGETWGEHRFPTIEEAKERAFFYLEDNPPDDDAGYGYAAC